MNASLSPPISRALAIAILIALIAALYFGVVQPLVDNYLADRQSIAQLQDAVAKFKDAPKRAPALGSAATWRRFGRSKLAGRQLPGTELENLFEFRRRHRRDRQAAASH